jgi:hypothetical protein
MQFRPPYTKRQRAMVENKSRILWIGTGTKTGKSFGLGCWLISGMLAGESTCFCGPWFFRSRQVFDMCKDLLRPFILSRAVSVNEARIKFYCQSGGYLDFTSADTPNAMFGGNYSRLVIDEASRCPAEIYPAGLTTISAAPNGKIRLSFNLELGVRNWAIRNLLRVQKLTQEERERTSEDYLTFPTGGDPEDNLVDPDLIATLKTQMPESLWLALYQGIIPTSDVSLFRNMEKVFTGRELEAPLP